MLWYSRNCPFVSVSVRGHSSRHWRVASQWDAQTSITGCTPSTGFTPGAGGQAGIFVVPATTEPITCTLTNTRSATGVLTLEKDWRNGAAGDTTRLSATGPVGSGSATAHVSAGGNGTSIDRQTAAVGDTLTYTITIANHGTGSAVDVVADDVLPPHVTVVSADTGGIGTFDAASGVWTIPVLPAGKTATLTLVVTVLPSASGQTRRGSGAAF
jgi:uncharacterized repeat protein (TIGR01451 family)